MAYPVIFFTYPLSIQTYPKLILFIYLFYHILIFIQIGSYRTRIRIQYKPNIYSVYFFLSMCASWSWPCTHLNQQNKTLRPYRNFKHMLYVAGFFFFFNLCFCLGNWRDLNQWPPLHSASPTTVLTPEVRILQFSSTTLLNLILIDSLGFQPF